MVIRGKCSMTNWGLSEGSRSDPEEQSELPNKSKWRETLRVSYTLPSPPFFRSFSCHIIGKFVQILMMTHGNFVLTFLATIEARISVDNPGRTRIIRQRIPTRRISSPLACFIIILSLSLLYRFKSECVCVWAMPLGEFCLWRAAKYSVYTLKVSLHLFLLGNSDCPSGSLRDPSDSPQLPGLTVVIQYSKYTKTVSVIYLRWISN